MKLLDEYRRLLKDVRKDCDDARSKSTNSQGLASLIRQQVQLVERIAEEEARIQAEDAARAEEDLPDAEIIDRAAEYLCAMPDPMLDAILSGVASARPSAVMRAKPRRLEIVGGRDLDDN